MRTAIMFGAFIISESINPQLEYSDSTVHFYAVVISIMIMMDIVDFFFKKHD